MIEVVTNAAGVGKDGRKGRENELMSVSKSA